MSVIDPLLQALRRRGAEPVLMEAGAGRALVCPELGGRVLAVESGEEQFLWFHPDLIQAGRAPDWNAGGQRTWLAPERAADSPYLASGSWQCPPDLDPGRYRRVSAPGENGLVLENRFELGAPGRRLRMVMERCIRLESAPAHLTMTVRQSVRYEGQAAPPPAFGAWALLQVPCPGQAVVRLEGAPAGRIYRDDFFQPLPPEWVRPGERCLVFRLNGAFQYKIGLPAERLPAKARVDYFCPAKRPGLLRHVCLTFEIPAGGLYLDGSEAVPSRAGDAIQLYNHFSGGAAAYAELEPHAPACLRPGELSETTVTHTFRTVAPEELPEGGQGEWVNG